MPTPCSPPLLAVEGLTVDVRRDRAEVPILSGVSFGICAGEVVGLVGDSGCGKSTLARALIQLLPPRIYRVGGSVRMNGRELLSLSERELEPVRGGQIGFIFQDPLLALNPVLRVGVQVAEVARAHGKGGMVSVEPLFELAGLPPERRIVDAYPHQLSGGERQRVTIAQALACGPPLVVADEPFTALDGAKSLELLGVFRRLKETLGTAFLLIAHHPGVLARIAGRVLTLRGGRLVADERP